MYLLSLDTAAKTAAVCVSKFDAPSGSLTPLVRAVVNSTLTHSESLLPMIDFCLKNASISFGELGAVAVSQGPGSFTGVRIGIATVKGLAFGKDLPCVGVSTLEALAYNLDMLSTASIILPVMDARRNQFYHAFFRLNKSHTPVRLSPDDLLTFDEIVSFSQERFAGKTVTLVGDGAEKFFTLWSKPSSQGTVRFRLCGSGEMYEDAFSVAKCAAPKLLSKPVSAKHLNPVYLRASQAEREREEKQKANQQ